MHSYYLFLYSGSKTKSRLKKAALVGAGVYAGYQLAKLSSKFDHRRRVGDYDFDDWNSWREVDGFMCRDNEDCRWVDSNLYCQDYELEFQPSVSTHSGILQFVRHRRLPKFRKSRVGKIPTEASVCPTKRKML